MIHVRAVLLSILTLCICSSMAKRLKIRLVNGKHHYEGRIEVFHNDKWGEVCDHKWDLKGARVACRMLGFPDALRYTSGDWYGRGTGFFWLDDVQCNGDEWSLDRCSRRDWGRCNCRRGQTAGVVCRLRDEEYVIKPIPFNTSQEIVDLPVRLLGPMLHDYISEGVLQVQVNKKWGYVCSEGWTDMNARVACGMLGYRDYFRGPPIRPTTPRKKKEKLKKMKNEREEEKEEIFMVTNLKCAGHESSIVECHHDGWGPLKCERGFPISIQCSRSAMFKNPKLRLRGSFRLWEGRVEVKSPKQSEKLHWGTVCDDHFDLKDANVVCRSLGLGTASRAYRGARFGQGSRSIYKDDVDCNGWEKDFDDCRSNTRSNCNHFEDASVQCNAPKLHNNKIRLAGGLSPLEGRVEVFDGIRWGAVCGENWGIEEATVACRHLGLGFAKDAVTRNSYFGVTSLQVIFSNVDCKLDELSLHHCERAVPERTACLSGRKAGVICVRAVPDLVINVEELEKHVRIDAIPLSYMRCSYEENCLAPSARVQWPNNRYYTRRLLRFTTRVENRGLAAFRPDVPKSSWQWHECHNHYHSMEVFSTYDLVDTAGMKAAAGHKASFCLEDTICDKGIPKKFNCTDGGDQGISPNCFDVYKWNIDCQWIDVTDFPHGSFYLRVTVNPHRKVAESDYLNNIAKCELYDYGNFAVAARCHLEECISGMDTHDGNSKGACCVFPFKYRGRIFRSCTKSGYNRFWCATTSDFDRSRRWGICY